MEAYNEHPLHYSKICQVETVPKISNIRTTYARRWDMRGEIVLNRIDSECDLIAADAQHHKNYVGRSSIVSSSMPNKSSQNVVERLVDERWKMWSEGLLEAFNKSCIFLNNNDDCQYLRWLKYA
ncbi:hypothetical protein AVEN_71032-1 [Araneus ventricosus]|uniref:Uncharacterized protein n=1 Tax=Araneus ventricosus TaxID=182803 RepID=A0A4Y2N1Q6_ARAVE|nr:hypothetical protein AVEN_71032-1 [Araneus ventricosus]